MERDEAFLRAHDNAHANAGGDDNVGGGVEEEVEETETETEEQKQRRMKREWWGRYEMTWKGYKQTMGARKTARDDSQTSKSTKGLWMPNCNDASGWTRFITGKGKNRDISKEVEAPTFKSELLDYWDHYALDPWAEQGNDAEDDADISWQEEEEETDRVQSIEAKGSQADIPTVPASIAEDGIATEAMTAIESTMVPISEVALPSVVIQSEKALPKPPCMALLDRITSQMALSIISGIATAGRIWTAEVCQWVFCLLLNVDDLLEAQDISILRNLLKAIPTQSADLEVQTLKVIVIGVVGKHYGQKDLLEQYF